MIFLILHIFFAGLCECIDSQGCLMDERRGGKHEHTWTFSSCSQQNFNKTLLSGLGACLFEDPFEVSMFSSIFSFAASLS